MDRTNLSDQDIRVGVWTYGSVDTEKQNPESVDERIPIDIEEREKLWINIGTISDLNDKERKIAKKEWLLLLPKLKNVRFLWVSGLVNQEFFDVICEMTWLEALCLKWTSVKTLDKITNLQNLLHLFIGSSSKLENIDGLSCLKKIITIQVEGFKLIHDISPIVNLATLKGLHIQGDIWKKQYISSLHGIEKLSNLEYFSIVGTEVTDKDVLPVTKLTKLINLDIGFWWTKEDLQLLYRSLPLLQYGSVKKAVETGEYEKYLRKIK